MRNQEAIQIKEEILKLEGSVSVGSSLVIDDVVRIQDVIDIINKHITGGEQ